MMVLLGVCAGTIMVFWLWIFYDHGVESPSLYWMPFATIAGLGMSIYIDKDINALTREVSGLTEAKYEYKKV